MNLIKQTRTIISAVILIIMSGSLIASAALSPLTPPPTGGYDVGMNSILDPGCTPGATDCFVKSAWTLNGNTGTNPATQFIGTTDAQDLVFKTNGTETMRLLSDTSLNTLYNQKSKLNVTGAIKANGLLLADETTGRNIVSEKTYVVEFENATNQKVKVYWPSFHQVDGVVEITVTGTYNYNNTNGGIKKRIGINARWNGILNMQQSETEYAIGYTRGGYTISDIQRDTVNGEWYFIVANLDNAKNTVGIHLKVTTVNGVSLATQTSITPVYTTDTTVYPMLSKSFFGSNVGVSNSNPSYLLHVGSSSIASGTSVARFENAGGTCTVTPNTAGGITCTSDINYKKDITDVSNPNILSKLTSLDVKSYRMTADTESSEKQIGFIAQNVETVFPHLVMTDTDGRKSVSYAGFAPVITSAIKELNTKVDMSILSSGNTTSTGFFDALKSWLGNAGNGLEKLFAREIETEKLCVKKSDSSRVCVTGDQLDNLLGNTNTSSNSGSSTGPDTTISGDTTSSGVTTGGDGTGGGSAGTDTADTTDSGTTTTDTSAPTDSSTPVTNTGELAQSVPTDTGAAE